MFAVVWVSLLCVPIVALVTFLIIQQRCSTTWLPAILIGILLGSYGLEIGGFSFVNPIANAGWLLLCYICFCFLAALCLLIKPKWLRALALLMTALPICIGYFLATIGVFGLAVIVIETFEDAFHIEQMPSGLICHVARWGMAFTNSGYTVRLYKPWNMLPFVERLVVSVSVDQTARDGEVSCSDALVRYNHQ